MTDSEREIEVRLDRLRRETEAIGPRPGFNARLLERLGPPRAGGGFLEALLRPSRRILPVAALAAAVAIVWAVRSEQDVDDALASSYSAISYSAISYSAMEIDW